MAGLASGRSVGGGGFLCHGLLEEREQPAAGKFVEKEESFSPSTRIFLV